MRKYMEQLTLDVLISKSIKDRISESYGSLTNMILNILREYPEARDSDNTLLEIICKTYDIRTIAQFLDSGISFVTLHKQRQYLQNKKKLFTPSAVVKDKRQINRKTCKSFDKGKN